MKKLLLLLSLMYSVNTFAQSQSGCTDPTACNYDPVATVDDSSCVYLGDPGVIPGCTYSGACNYDALATCDDGSCDFPWGCGDTLYLEYDPIHDGCNFADSCITLIVNGCTDPLAFNYDPSANTDDGSCVPVVNGCTDVSACNYDSAANVDDGSCILPDGCTDSTACNYDPSAQCDDGSCILPDGCIYPIACNYDSTATCDDGSCIFPDGCTDPNACNYDSTALCDDGSCLIDYGCMDVSACNYDSTATCDDGSCILPDGCTDPNACNYDPAATCDDGSCLTDYGCTDPNACNYDVSATCDDGSCLTNYGCMDETSCNYDASATCDDGSCYTIESSISQEGEMLNAVTNPTGLEANWYNIQDIDGETRIWLMQESATSYSPTFDCSYFIIVEDENGCVDTSETYYFGEMAARIGNIVTYPNPATDLVTLEFDNHKSQVVKFDLIDNNGVKVEQYITTSNSLEIDLGKYPSGIYYISFDATNNTEGCLTQEKQKTLSKIILNK